MGEGDVLRLGPPATARPKLGLEKVVPDGFL